MAAALHQSDHQGWRLLVTLDGVQLVLVNIGNLFLRVEQLGQGQIVIVADFFLQHLDLVPGFLYLSLLVIDNRLFVLQFGQEFFQIALNGVIFLLTLDENRLNIHGFPLNAVNFVLGLF